MSQPKTRKILHVAISGRLAGRLQEETGGSLTFEYLHQWQEDRNATPISLSMPLARRIHTDDVVRPFLWNLLPDNASVLSDWARKFRASAGNPFSLLKHVGEECAGAVQFIRDERLEQVLDGPGDVEWMTLDDVESYLAELAMDPSAWLQHWTSGQFSLGGAQAKVALLKSDTGQWAIPSGRIPTSHILKPAIPGLADHDLNEHLCLAAARAVGLTAAQSEVVKFGRQRAIVVTRYDRIGSGTGRTRIHQEDLCQALGRPPGQKYQNEGGPTPAEIVRLIRAAVRPALQAETAVSAFIDALGLNWILGGTDAHAKNYSLLLNAGQVRLAPLYDIASALPYPHLDPLHRKLAMKIGSRYLMEDILGRHWIALAKALTFDPDLLIDRLENLTTAFPEALTLACDTPAIKSFESSLPTRLAESVAVHAKACRARLLAR